LIFFFFPEIEYGDAKFVLVWLVLLVWNASDKDDNDNEDDDDNDDDVDDDEDNDKCRSLDVAANAAAVATAADGDDAIELVLLPAPLKVLSLLWNNVCICPCNEVWLWAYFNPAGDGKGDVAA
jgi:hypothetical protein